MTRSRTMVRVALLTATSLLLGCSSGEPESAAPPSPTAPADAPAPIPVAELTATPKPEPIVEPAPAEPTAKQWKDPVGNVLAIGEFVSLMDEYVCLETPEGLGARVLLEKLCQADRELVLGRPEANPTVVEDRPVVVEEAVEQVTSLLPAVTAADYGHEKVVIPFDFVSKFDDGHYGGKIGEMVVTKIQKQGTFVVPDVIDIRDVCAENRITITPQTPLAEIGRVVRDLFDAEISIWGSCEKAPGHEWEVYDLTIKCADFSVEPEPRMLYEVTARTNSVSEIPHLYVKNMLDALHGREPGGPDPLDPIAEQYWAENPTLVGNVGFDAGSRGKPHGWEDRGGQHREPLGGLVQWTAESGSSDNRVVRFTFDAGVGDGYGVMYYSKPFPIEEQARYRAQFRYRSNGPTVKVFIKCYAEVPGNYVPPTETPAKVNHTASPGRVEYVHEIGQVREVYRSQQNPKGAKNQWHTHTEDFTPKHTRYTPQWGRVMLYAYLGAGVVEFDDVVVKQILPASASDQKKKIRHSQDSGVTIKDMEANERRAREERQR